MKDDKLLTIGEVTRILGVTRRMIINYEQRGLLKPDERGESDTGYRYYTLDSMVRIRTIRVLQDMGLSLDEIKAYLDDNTDLSPMLRRLEILRDELNLRIEQLQERIRTGNEERIRRISIPQQTVYRRVKRVGSLEQRKNDLRDTMYAALQVCRCDISKRLLWSSVPLDDPELISYNVAVDEDSIGENVLHLPGVQALACYHHGAYEGLPAVRERLLAYARERGIRLEGSCRNVYLEGPPQHKDPEKFVTMVAIPIIE